MRRATVRIYEATIDPAGDGRVSDLPWNSVQRAKRLLPVFRSAHSSRGCTTSEPGRRGTVRMIPGLKSRASNADSGRFSWYDE